MPKVVGTVSETYSFRSEDIIQLGLNAHTSIEEVADILAANVELPEERDDGTIEIIESNFNDSFDDMIEELSGS